MKRRSLLILVCCSGCSILPKKQPPVITVDLGPAPEGGSDANGRPIAIPSVSAPAWLESNAIEYRLEYEDGFRRQSYRDVRWVAPPAALIRQRFAERVSQRSDGKGAERPDILQIEIDEFVQVFDTPTSSRVNVQVRATVQGRQLPAFTRGRTFRVEKPAKTPDSAGAIRALAAAVDEIVAQTLTWAREP